MLALFLQPFSEFRFLRVRCFLSFKWPNSCLESRSAERSFTNVNILEGISQCLLYMFSEPLIMTLHTRVLGLTSMKVELISFRYKLFDRCINPCLRVFFGHFDRISLSTASPYRRRRKNISGGGGGGFFRGHHLCLVLC